MMHPGPRFAPPVPFDPTAQVEDIQTQLQLLHGEEKKLMLLMRVVQQLHRSAPAVILDISDQAFRLATHLRDSRSIAHIHYHRGLCRSQLGHDGGLQDLVEAYDIYSGFDMEAEAAAAAFAAGREEIAAGDHREGLEWLSRALERCDRCNADDVRVGVLAALGNLSIVLGDYTRAVDYNLQVLAACEKKGDDNGTGLALSELGVVYGLLEDYESAFGCFEQSVALFRSTGNRYLELKALTNLGGIHYSRGELDLALEYVLTGLIVYETINDTVGTATALITAGNIYEHRDEVDLALDHQLRAYAALEDLPPGRLHVSALLNIGRLHRKLGNYDDAREVLDEALVLAREFGDRHLQYEAHEALSTTWEELGDLGEALHHHRRYAAIRTELAGEEKQKEIRELQIRFDVEKAERERDRYQERVKEVENELREKQGELTALTLALVERTEFIEAVRREIVEVERRTDGSTPGGGGRLMKVLNSGRGGVEEPDNWVAFEAQFQQLHHDFIYRVSQRHRDLTPTELKVCALLRLNLPSKDIATILHMSARTVESHRYWIRRKLALPARANLKSFLAAI